MAKVVKEVRVCDKCETQGVTVHKVTVDGTEYILELCSADSAAFTTALSKWLDLGQQVEHYRRFTDGDLSDGRRIAELRARDAARRADLERVKHDAPAAQRVAEANARKGIPGAARWDMTAHARERMELRGYSAVDVFLAVTAPEHRVSQPWKGKGRAVYVRGECKVVASELDGMIITVLSRDAELDSGPRMSAAAH